MACARWRPVGKPVAAAVGGLALGGGGELALAAHYRVLDEDGGHAAIGLPEALVGLLPGAGGTQRLPRLIGVGAAMRILSKAAGFGEAALKAGLAHAVVDEGEEIAAAETFGWLVAVANSTVGPRGFGIIVSAGGERSAGAGPAGRFGKIARALSRACSRSSIASNSACRRASTVPFAAK